MVIRDAEQKQSSLSARSKQNLDQYCSTLSSNCERDIFDDKVFRVLQDYVLEGKQLARIRSYLTEIQYSQSRKEYSQIEQQIAHFAQNDYTSFRWNSNYQAAKKKLIHYFKRFRLKALQYTCDEDIVEALPKLDTHAGWTAIETGFKKKGENLEEIFQRINNEIASAKESGSFNKPILCGVRTQCKNNWIDESNDYAFTHNNAEHKTRLVSMIDLDVIIAELIWAKPFQRVICSDGWYSGGSSDREILQRINHLRGKYSKWISLDYSKFDQSISSWLIKDAFEVVEAAFEDLGDVKLLEIVKSDFINKIFVDGNGNMIQSHKGVPSGSMFTQIIDSIVNRLMIETYCISKGYACECNIMGDDNLIFTNDENFTKEDVCSYLTKNFGILANDDKSTWGTRFQDPEYLSRYWRQNGAWRHKSILTAKLLYPERFRNYKLEGVSPELIIYSYILAYPRGMDELINVGKFLREHKFRYEEALKFASKHLTGYLAYQMSYYNVRPHEILAS